MARWAYLLTTFFALAAWAGAQGPAPASPLSTADQLRLLRANSTLITNLVDNGVALSSSAGGPKQRAEQCRSAAKALASAIQDAAGKQEAERVAELADLFRDVVRDALLPTLDDAKRTVPPESPDAARIKEIRANTERDVRELKAALPTTGKVAESGRIQATFKQIDELEGKLK